MSADARLPSPENSLAIRTRSRELESDHYRRIHVGTDRFLAILLLAEWPAALGMAIWISPLAWEGRASHVHPHVWAAVSLGALLALYPAWVARRAPGEPYTRHLIAFAQAWMAALFIHLSGGRIETHFLVFGSLAFLAFYRDPAVLVTFSAAVTLDHWWRGRFFPESVFGVLLSSPWRWLEHAGWVAFESAFLWLSIRRSQGEMRAIADREAYLEATNRGIESVVEQRTVELRASEQRSRALNEDLEARERYFRSLIEKANDLITVSDAKGRAVFLSPSHAGVLGYSIEKLTGVSTLSLAHPEDVDCVKAFFRSIRESPVETLQTAEFRVRRDDGSWCVLEASGRNLLHDPHVHGIVITSRDVTEKRTAEAELRRALDAAEAANRAKTEFLAIVSHEIRTPMNGVINMAELLLADPLTPSQREEVEVLQNSAKSLSGLIDDLLDLTRAQSGRLALDSAPFDLVRVAREVVRILSPSAAKKRVVVDLDVGEGIPPRIVGDATRVRQVLTNLVGNGIKFTSAGRVILKVSAANAAAGRTRIEIAVSDTGIGLTADQIEKLFQRFTQADPSTRRRFGGTGLGLAISKELVESMGGSIAVESVPGAGTKFSVTIDFEDGAEGPTSAPGNAAEGATAPGPRILAVERDAGSLEIVTRPLRRLGFAVDQARAPEEALRALEHGPYDLVLLDCDEDLDASCAAIREFRSREAGETRTAVVALLSTTSEVDRRRCIASGMDEVLAKPFTPKQLRSAVQRHVVRPVAGPLRATA